MDKECVEILSPRVIDIQARLTAQILGHYYSEKFGTSDIGLKY